MYVVSCTHDAGSRFQFHAHCSVEGLCSHITYQHAVSAVHDCLLCQVSVCLTEASDSDVCKSEWNKLSQYFHFVFLKLRDFPFKYPRILGFIKERNSWKSGIPEFQLLFGLFMSIVFDVSHMCWWTPRTVAVNSWNKEKVNLCTKYCTEQLGYIYVVFTLTELSTAQ